MQGKLVVYSLRFPFTSPTPALRIPVHPDSRIPTWRQRSNRANTATPLQEKCEGATPDGETEHLLIQGL